MSTVPKATLSRMRGCVSRRARRRAQGVSTRAREARGVARRLRAPPLGARHAAQAKSAGVETFSKTHRPDSRRVRRAGEGCGGLRIAGVL